METCSNCGAVARPGAKFCTTCGSRLSPVDAPSSATGWQQPAASDSADTVLAPAATASGAGESSAAASDTESQDGPPPTTSSWTWGSSDSTASSASDEAADTDDAPASHDDAAESIKSPASAASSWSWNTGAQVAGESVRDDEAPIDSTEQADQDSDVDAETEAPADSVAASPLAGVSSSPDDSSTDTATTSTWSWGESHSGTVDGASASEIESSPAASDVADTNGDDVSALATSSPDGEQDQVASTADAGSTTPSGSESVAEFDGDSSSSDVDVSSAFADDTQAEGEGEETLSSWAARWNETEADNVETAVTSDDLGSSDAADAPASATASNDSVETASDESDAEPTEQSSLEDTADSQQSAADESADSAEPEASIESGIESDSQPNPDVSILPAYASENAADEADPLAGMDVLTTAAATAASDAASSTGVSSAESARNRAEQLIDELRDLLPSLTASGSNPTDSTAGIAEGSGSDQNLQPVIDDLAAARPESGSFDDLRAALEKARTNPRDVDTMLDLVGRVDDLIALLDSQDRLNTAAGQAIDRLQQAGTHSEE